MGQSNLKGHSTHPLPMGRTSVEHQSPVSGRWKVREPEVITPDSEHTLLDMKGMTTQDQTPGPGVLWN